MAGSDGGENCAVPVAEGARALKREGDGRRGRGRTGFYDQSAGKLSTSTSPIRPPSRHVPRCAFFLFRTAERVYFADFNGASPLRLKRLQKTLTLNTTEESNLQILLAEFSYGRSFPTNLTLGFLGK